MNDYYVYVYIDPRNHEEFYYSKGRGSRKSAHLYDSQDSEKAKRIKAINKAGLEPIIRVIARGLSERDALLVEKTLLWKLGKQLTNVASGHYASNFRPHNKIHTELSGYDFQNGLYYYNVGEGDCRNWDDYRKYGFISAGQAPRFRDAMLQFNRGDVVAAYLKGRGFVGVAKIRAAARPVREVTVRGKRLLDQPLCQPGLVSNIKSNSQCEYVCLVSWIRKVDRNEAKWRPKSGLFTSRLIRASLDNQPRTIRFLEEEFDLDLRKLVT